MPERIVIATNWTLDGLPIEEGFRVADILEDDEESDLMDITAGTRVGPHEFVGMPPAYQICDVCDMTRNHAVHQVDTLEVAAQRVASRTAADDGPEADEQETCEAVTDWAKPGANGRVLCGDTATHSLELNGHTYNYCRRHRDLFMESAGRNSLAKDVKEKELGEKSSSIALRYALGPCDCDGYGCLRCDSGSVLRPETA